MYKKKYLHLFTIPMWILFTGIVSTTVIAQTEKIEEKSKVESKENSKKETQINNDKAENTKGKAAKATAAKKVEKVIQLLEFKYVIKKDDDFAYIIQKFVKPDSVINARTPMVIQTREANPHIKDWENLIEGTEIVLMVSENFLDSEKIKKLIESGEAKEVKEEVAKEEPKETPEADAKKPVGVHFSAFYMASSGSFTQISEDSGVNITFNQNSMVSLGVSGLYFIPQKPMSVAASIYFSSLQTPSTNDGQAINIPAEIGFNAYFQHDLDKYKFTYYGGFDFESFSTFNMGLLATSNTIVVDHNSVLYLTAGVSKLFNVKKIGNIFSKLSLSKSLFTTTSIGDGGIEPNEGYGGFKLMLYLNYKFHKKWFAHTLFKFHTMSAEDSLSVTRLGLGFGYIIN